MIHIRTFQNYHRHSVYTNVRITDSTVGNEEYAKRASELGHGIISTVEHGWQGRYIEGYELAKKYNLKFVFGTEAYWVKDRFEKERTNCHIILLAKNEKGRKAINKALSEANVTGFYHQPRLDIDLLLSLPSNDIICTTACVGYWRYEDVDEITFLLSNHFEKNFFLEVQYHNTDSQKELNKHILELSEKYGIDIIMGCDSHFIFPEQEDERVNYLNSRGLHYDDEDGWYLDYPDGETAYKRFLVQGVLTDEQIDRAMNNTNILLEVEEYDSDIFQKEIKMPTIFPDLTKEEKDKMLENIIMKEWEKEKLKIPKEKWDLYEAEIKKELDIVFVTNHSDYFLDDYYIIKKAKELGGVITPSGRGSGVSFVINKYLGFTKIDRVSSPVKLFPERFMSATRILEAKTLADFDINTANPEVFARAQEIVFGKDKTAPMIAYGTLKPKAAWKMYARAQKIDFETANNISEQLDRAEFALKHVPEDEKEDLDKQEFILKYVDKKYHKEYLSSLRYQGIVSDWKIHPCASLLYNKNISEEVGMVVIKSGKKETFCCCMDGKWAEDYKFLKNDLLKVSVVDLIDRVFKRINREIPDVNELLETTKTDEKVWDVYKKSITMGINQVEQVGTSHRVGVYAPRNISEVCAFVAAIRPGFKSMYKTFENREKFEYGIKSLDDLIQTPEMPQSFLLYQETQMAVLNYAGIDMSECYEIIKNIAKKRVEKVLKYKDMFLDGFTKRMIEIEKKTQEEAKELSDKIWTILEDSSRYSFNACISGDAIVMRTGSGKKLYKPTIEEMYLIKNDREYSKRTGHINLHDKYRRNGYGVALSMFEDGRVRKNKIVDIYQSGVQRTYKITTNNGSSLVCTSNHKFPTPKGQKMLMDISVGDEVYVIGKYEKNIEKYPFTDGKFKSNVPKIGQRGFQKMPDGNSVLFNTTRIENVANRKSCDICGCEYEDGKRFELHHKDFDRTNNSIENLGWLCVGCHKKEHYKKDRKKVFEKGIPTIIDIIKSIEFVKEEMTYDIEMQAPAHNFISESGLVTSNSHSLSVAVDSLYGAYLKANYTIYFYECFMKLLEESGDKDRLNMVKQEAQDYYGIKFPMFKFGQDNRAIIANPAKNEILNSLRTLKGFGKNVAEELYRLGQKKFDNFLDLLYNILGTSINSRQLEILVKIDYFTEYFGINSRTQMEILNALYMFNDGQSKQMAIKNIDENSVLESIIKRNSRATDKTYMDLNTRKILEEYQQYLISSETKDFTIKEKIVFQQEYLGYIAFQTNEDEDRTKLVITDIIPLKTKDKTRVWAYRLSTISIGTGKQSDSIKIFAQTFEKNPISKTDVIYVRPQNIKKDEYNGEMQYWLNGYTIINI